MLTFLYGEAVTAQGVVVQEIQGNQQIGRRRPGKAATGLEGDVL